MVTNKNINNTLENAASLSFCDECKVFFLINIYKFYYFFFKVLIINIWIWLSR